MKQTRKSNGVEDGGDERIDRIAKVLARAGLCSRRDAERWIEEGRVAINGRTLTSPAVNVKPGDEVTVDGKPLPERERTRLWLYHKPRGLVTTARDPEGRETVFEALPESLPRVVAVGRLDINTEGLLLLTNDGGLARVLELPATGWLRRYRVRAYGREITPVDLEPLKDGVTIEGIVYGSVEAQIDRVQGANTWLTIGLREGKNREVKKILGHLGLEVSRLIRISYGPFQLGDLPEGEVVEIRGRMLRDQLGPRLMAEAETDFDAPIRETTAEDAPKRERRVRPQAETAERRAPREERGERPARARREEGGDRPFRPRREEGGSERPYRPRRSEAGEGAEARSPRPYRERRPGGEERPARAPYRAGDRTEGGRPATGRSEAGDRFRRDRGGEDRPRGPRSDAPRHPRRDEAPSGDRPARPARPSRSGGERGTSEERPFRARRLGGDRPSADRPQRERSFGGGEGRSERPRGARPPRRDEAGRPDRPPRARAERNEGGDRPARGEGFKPRTPRSGGDRPFGGRSERPASDRPFGDRKPRGPRPERGESRSGGPGRPGGHGEGGPGGRKGPPRGDRPGGGRPGGGRPGGRPGGGDAGRRR